MTAVTVLSVSDSNKNSIGETEEGDIFTLIGKSKGKGFQGVVKRHGFHGGPASHGQKNRLRAPGSIGATAPQRVILGTKMAGRTGNRQVTLKRMIVESVNFDKGILMVRGAVPGMRGSKVKLISH